MKEKYVKPDMEIIELDVEEGIMSTSPGSYGEDVNDVPTDNSEGGVVAYSRKRNFWE